MKKFLSGIVAAFLLTAGLVGVSGELAQAAPAPRACATSYTPCPSTTIKVRAAKVVKQGSKPKSKVRVLTTGNIKPLGTLKIVYKGYTGKRKSVKTLYSGQVAYKGKAKSITGPQLKKKGTYTVFVFFKPTNNVKASKTSYKIRVK